MAVFDVLLVIVELALFGLFLMEFGIISNDSVEIDNFVFRLHSTFTKGLFLLAFAFATVLWTVDRITCVANGDYSKDFLEEVCWFQDTFTIPNR
jgi:hypothetical protein